MSTEATKKIENLTKDEIRKLINDNVQVIRCLTRGAARKISKLHYPEPFHVECDGADISIHFGNSDYRVVVYQLPDGTSHIQTIRKYSLRNINDVVLNQIDEKTEDNLVFLNKLTLMLLNKKFIGKVNKILDELYQGIRNLDEENLALYRYINTMTGLEILLKQRT